MSVRRASAATLALFLVAAAAAQSVPSTVVGAIGRTVADLDASVRFYTEVLAFRVVDRGERQGAAEERRQGVFALHTRTAVLQLGEERIELTEFLTPRGRAMPSDARSNDRWFQHLAIVVRDMDAAHATLRRQRVRHASPSPQTLPASNPVAGGIRAFYFHDPDGHPLEILWFPAGKGDPRWHVPGPELFLGIDHTAIVVADTEDSLRCWRDQLGLVVVGVSDNHGEEQERLAAVFGARLRITTLRGRAGPGVELLEYVTPRTGRPMPTDTAANDLWHQTVAVTSEDLASTWAAFARAGRGVASPAADRGPAQALVHDPDGHRVLLVGALARAR